MELLEIKTGDRVVCKLTGVIWLVEQTSPYIKLNCGGIIKNISYDEVSSYEIYLDENDKPIPYNKLLCKSLLEVLKSHCKLNKVDIDDISILESTYDPKNGSMTFSIKIN